MIKAILVLISFFAIISAFAQSTVSPFNKVKIDADSMESYHFYASGHFHGSGRNYTGYPINSLLANISQLNGSNAAFVACLGDLFLDIKNDVPFYEKSFFSQLTIPLFNSVGNHDLSGDIYQKKYGATDFYFMVGQDKHLFFDTERNNGSLESDQLEMLRETYLEVASGMVRQVFIYCHRTIWAKHYAELDGLFSDNTHAVMGNNFSDEVYPLLEKISEKAPVFWFSGSIGDAPASFFYHQDAIKSITYIATAIRGFKRDAWLDVSVSSSGKISYETISLTGQKLKKLEEYNVSFWKTTSSKQPFNYKLIPYYTKLVLLHRAFWYGVITTLVIFSCVWFYFRRRKKLGK